MKSLRACRSSGQESGFTVVELLIAMTITLLVAGAIAGVTQPARDAFDRVPAELDLQQRGRIAIEVMSQALRSAGRNVAAAERLGLLSDLVPAASVFDPDESGRFTSLEVIVPATDAAQGVLAADQSGAAAAITLAVAPCPDVDDVCGFTPGSTALDHGWPRALRRVFDRHDRAGRASIHARNCVVTRVSDRLHRRRNRSVDVQPGPAA